VPSPSGGRGGGGGGAGTSSAGGGGGQAQHPTHQPQPRRLESAVGQQPASHPLEMNGHSVMSARRSAVRSNTTGGAPLLGNVCI
jgi:hypothetical protein